MGKDPLGFSTQRLGFRPAHPTDAPQVFAYRSLEAVARFQGWQPASVEEVERRLLVPVEPDLPDTWYPLAIESVADGVLIGDCAVHVLADIRQVEIGITVAPDFQGRGYATEAVHGLVRHLFEVLGKHRIVASVDPRNAPCMALLRRIGFRQEAHFVESLWFRDGWVDDVVFAMLGHEWSNQT